MKRNKKLNEVFEKDLSQYNNEEFLDFLKKTTSKPKESQRKRASNKGVWAVCITTVVVVSLVVAFVLGVFFYPKNLNTFTKKAIDRINSFVQNVQFKNISDGQVTIYVNQTDVNKPKFHVSGDEVEIDVYSGDALLISENIYEIKTSTDKFDLNSFEQTFSENNDEHISISGFINTGKEILYFIYVKPLGKNDKDEFMKKGNENLLKALNDIIKFNV